MTKTQEIESLRMQGYTVAPSKSKAGTFRWWRETGSDGVSVPRRELSDTTYKTAAEAWDAAKADSDIVFGVQTMEQAVAPREIIRPIIHAESDSDGLSFFAVTVRFGKHGDKGGPYDIPGGGWRGLANDESGAEAKAYDACWDERLTDCYPVYDTEQLHRYIASNQWPHVFLGSREETVRWIFDRGALRLMACQVLDGERWISMAPWPMKSLLDSIIKFASDELPPDVQEWSSLPAWSDIETSLDVETFTEQPRG